MSLNALCHWQAAVRKAFGFLGCWQVLGLALYSYGVVLARQCAPSRVAEKLPLVGKADTVQRRLERWLDNKRIDWQVCCRAWSGWVLRHYRGQRLIVTPILARHLHKISYSLNRREAARIYPRQSVTSHEHYSPGFVHAKTPHSLSHY